MGKETVLAQGAEKGIKKGMEVAAQTDTSTVQNVIDFAVGFFSGATDQETGSKGSPAQSIGSISGKVVSESLKDSEGKSLEDTRPAFQKIKDAKQKEFFVKYGADLDALKKNETAHRDFRIGSYVLKSYGPPDTGKHNALFEKHVKPHMKWPNLKP